VLGVKCVTHLCVIVYIKVNSHYYKIVHSSGVSCFYILEIRKSYMLLVIKAQHLELLFSYISSKMNTGVAFLLYVVTSYLQIQECTKSVQY
jgi:hypothetical protein